MIELLGLFAMIPPRFAGQSKLEVIKMRSEEKMNKYIERMANATRRVMKTLSPVVPILSYLNHTRRA
jgi:hypothetical protein